jgi:Domain of unknown function (DUF4158)/Tn3 transposase DDE domain
MPVEFLTDDEAAVYGRYAGSPSQADLERVFFLDDEDMDLVGQRRGEHMKVGFALQLVTARWLGTFLDDPLDVPAPVLEFVAGQLGVADPLVVNKYGERVKTLSDHQVEIRRAEGLRDFTEAQEELAVWVTARSWTSGDGPKAIFLDAIAWMRERKILLPGVSRLARLVARVRDDTTHRLLADLEGLLTPVQRRVLDRLLDVPQGKRVSDLERWRKGPPPRGSGPAIIAALDQVAEIQSLGLAGLGAEPAVPPRRLGELARYGMTADAWLIRWHPDDRRLATLLATARHLEAKSVDDALELLDLLMSAELLNRAQREADKDKARKHPRLARASARLAVAVEALFDSDGWGGPDEEPRVSQVWEAIEAVISRADLRSALAVVSETVPPPGAEDPDGWRAGLLSRYQTVIRVLEAPAGRDLVRCDRRGRAGAGRDAGAARRPGLPQPPARPAGPRPPHQGRRGDRPVAAAGARPPRARGRRRQPARLRLLRAGAVLARPQAPRHLRRRLHPVAQPAGPAPGRRGVDGDPRRRADHPQPARRPGRPAGRHARALDAAYREVGGRLAASTEVTIGDDGKIHLTGLKAIEEPPSLADLRARATAMLPRVELPEVILEVMSWAPELAEAFTAVSGGRTRLDDLPVSLAACLAAHSMNIGYRPIAKKGVPALERARLSHVFQNYVRPETLAAANAPLVARQAGLPLAQAWGGGMVAAVDGMRFVVPVPAAFARPNRKYFGSKRGMTWLNAINDRGMGAAPRSCPARCGTPCTWST